MGMEFKEFYDKFIRQLVDEFIQNNKAFIYKNSNGEYINVTEAFHSGELRTLLYWTIDERRHYMLTGFPRCNPEDLFTHNSGVQFSHHKASTPAILSAKGDLPDISALKISLEDFLLHTTDAIHALFNQHPPISETVMIKNNNKKEGGIYVDLTPSINAFNESITSKVGLYYLAMTKPDAAVALMGESAVNEERECFFTEMNNRIPQEHRGETISFLDKMNKRLHSENDNKFSLSQSQTNERQEEVSHSYGMRR